MKRLRNILYSDKDLMCCLVSHKRSLNIDLARERKGEGGRRAELYNTPPEQKG